MDIFNYIEYRDYLKDALALKISKNPSLSLSSFSRQIGVSPSLMSEVFSRKKGLSFDRASKVSEGLRLDSVEREYFCLMVHMDSVKELDLKESILNRYRKKSSKKSVDLSVDHFRVISSWYHFAILELTELNDFVMTPATIAKKVEISSFEAELAIDRLFRLGLLEKCEKKGFKQSVNHLNFLSEEANKALQNFHKQTMTKAIESLDKQTNDEKFIGSETLAFNSEKLVEARGIINKCFDELVELSDATDLKDEVYHMGIQLFRLTNKNV